MFKKIPREEIDAILFEALRAVYQFQQSKVSLFGLNYEDIYLLQFVRRKSPTRMGEIAAEMNIPISTATRVVDRLEKMKLLSRKKDDADRRNILVSLEQAGEEMVQKVEDHTFEILTENLTNFSDAEIESFVKTAISLSEILKVEMK